jgi:purine-nucleoside phosphorylase
MSDAASLSSADLDARVAEALAAIRTRTRLVPEVAITLGSGLGGVVDEIRDATRIATTSIPHWPKSTVAGHAGTLALGSFGGVAVVALAGRSHRYEGYTLDRVTFGVRVMRALGARTMIFTNAVGAMNSDYRPGDLMLATDHINFIGRRALLTPQELIERRAGRRAETYYARSLREALRRAALRASVPLRLGVLMGGQGPSYETSSEVRMAIALGADVACMSTVHEVTVAAELGCEAASLSCVTNLATGISDQPLHHAEVTEVADRAAVKLRAVIEEYLRGRSAPRGEPR